MADSTVAIALLFPELLGTYGDGGNARILERRLAWRGIAATVVEVPAGTPVPETCQLYLLGGGEDAPQTEAARELTGDDGEGPLHRAVRSGAVAFAVCAGMQILGARYVGRDGEDLAGLGLLPCDTVRTGEDRAVGELLATPQAAPELGIDPAALGPLTGFENHGGRTRPHPGATTLARVDAGVGNGDGTEGIIATLGAGRVLGTYLHGPALARNPALADLLAMWAIGEPLEPLDDPDTGALRAERIATAERGALDGVAHRSWKDRLLGRN